MFVQLTADQLRVTKHAAGFFRALATSSDMIPMFREAGRDMNVGLAYSEDGNHYIVRETIPANSSLGHIYDVCNRILSTMAYSYSTTRAMQRLMNGEGADYSGA